MSLVEKALSEVAASVDRFVHRSVINRPPSRRSLERQLGPEERIRALRELREEVADLSWLPEAEAAPQVLRHLARRSGSVVATDLRYPSPHGADALHFEDLRPRWMRYPENQQVHARWIRGGEAPRPTVVLLHGYLGGNLALEERVWPVSWMLSRGLDVVLGVLPFHGPRRRAGRLSPPPFPGGDPRLTIEGFRQAVRDLRVLVRWLRAEGAPAVGAMGQSLGGYASALLATAEPLEFVVPFIPLASIADFARESGRLVGTATQQRMQHTLLEEVYAIVSPLARPPRVPEDARLVVAADADAITPIDHAKKIATHFGAPLETFAGGHLLQIDRGEGFRAVGRMLGRLGLLAPRPEATETR